MSAYGAAVAYEYHDMTMCARCAFKATAFGLVLAGGGVPSSMEDAIARMMLLQVERKLEIVVPVAIDNPEGKCVGSCGRAFSDLSSTSQEGHK